MTQRRSPFNICQISLNLHRHIFDDLIGSLQGALQDLGHDCTRSQNMMKVGRVNILIGNLVGLRDRPNAVNDLRRYPYTAYQLGQMDARIGLAAYNGPYYRILEGAVRIWDYSPANLDFPARTDLRDKVSFLPPAYHRSLEHFIPAENQDIDVLFYGARSERRTRIIEQLRAAGVNAVSLFGVYGEALHDQLRRAKIVLNVHGTADLVVLETVRLSFLLANRCFVVSQAAEYDPYGDGLVFAEYGQLTQACLHWLEQGREPRRAVAERGYAAMRQDDMAARLSREIASLPIEQLSPAAVPR